MKIIFSILPPKKNKLLSPCKALGNFIILFLLQGSLVMVKLAVRAFFTKSSPLSQTKALIAVTITVRYHSGGSIKLNTCILHLAYMVYL